MDSITSYSRNTLTAAHHNNHAASMIDSGDFYGAIQELWKGLNITKQLSLVMERYEYCHSHNGTSCIFRDEYMVAENMKNCQHEMNWDKDASSTVNEPQHQQSMARGEQHYLYQHPMRVSNSTIKDILLGGEGMCSLNEIAISILFNTALSHQLMATTKSNISEKYMDFSRAARLYELTYNMYREHCPHGGLLFPMAVLNNLAVAHSTLQCTDIAGRCFEQLLSMLMLLSAAGDHKTLSCCSGFWGNTSHCMLPKMAAPAA